jgi:hypothetical protein
LTTEICAVALAVLLEFVVEVAFTVQVSLAAGAVYNPALLIDPQEADHVTD